MGRGTACVLYPLSDKGKRVLKFLSCGNTDHLALIKLQQLQNKGAKTILRVPKETPPQIVLNDLKWLPLTKRITYHTHILMLKCLNGHYISRTFKYVNHCYNTRYQDKQVLYVSKLKLEITKN